MVQENSYWNHHLFDACYKKGLMYFFIVFTFIVTSILLSLPVLDKHIGFTFARICLVLLSSLVGYEILDKSLTWRSSSKTMLSIDNQLNFTDPSYEDIVMLIFSHYSVVNVMTPPIADEIYIENKDKLNMGWSKRINKYKSIFESDH